MADASTLERACKERTLFQKCLDLGQTDDPRPLLEQTLHMLRELVHAECGYIELVEAAVPGGRTWTTDVGLDEGQRVAIRDRISHGVIAEAIESQRTVLTASASLDERFAGRESVQSSRIEAVLCVPLRAHGVLGVVYLQNRLDAAAFEPDDVRCAETVARFASSLAARMLEVLRRRASADATQTIRRSLNATGVIGTSRALAELLRRLAAVAKMESDVLLVGGSGCGKSMLARVLHENSRRSAEPFIEVNCAALPPTLAESELFGAERGVHSAVAHKGTTGKLEAARAGTLFLDEIGELDPHVQAKLLHVLQSRQYFRLGGTKPLPLQARVLTATNRDLEGAIADGSFREDLYYRIRSTVLRVPTLGERREDIRPLAEHICERLCEEERLPPLRLSTAAIAALEFAEWPGNVRQLRNAIREGLVSACTEGNDVVDTHHLFVQPDTEPSALLTFLGARERFERAFLAAELVRRDWNVSLTARELALSRSHLNAMIRRYDLRR